MTRSDSMASESQDSAADVEADIQRAQGMESRLLGTNFGYTASAVLDAALELRIFDQLSCDVKTVDSVAASNGWSADGTQRLFAALVHVGLLTQEGEGRYVASRALGELLSTESPSSLSRHLRAVYKARTSWDNLAEVVRTGHRPNLLGHVDDRRGNVDFFVRGGEELLNDARTVARLAPSVIDEPVVVLYAGGGEWAIGLAEANPRATVYAIDTPEFLDRARARIRASTASDRVHLVPTHEEIQRYTATARVVLVPPVLRFLDDQTVDQILSAAVRSTSPSGELLLVDAVDESGDDGQGPKPMLELSLLINTAAGRLRSATDYKEALDRAGARLCSVEKLGLLTLMRANRTGAS